MTDHGGWMFFGGGYMWLIWILVIVGAVILLKSVMSDSAPTRRDQTPLDILKQRFAKGEITEEEFKRMKHDIES